MTALDALASVGSSLSRDLLVDGPTRLTGARLERQVAVCAGGLVELGVTAGDAVAWQRPNSWESVVLMRACWRIAAVAVPLHHRIGEDEAADVAATCDAIMLDAEVLPRGPALEGGAAATDPTVTPDSPALVLRTSGSSGVPKGVVHTHAGLVALTMRMAALHALDERDVVLMPAPLAHISGVLNAVLLPAATPFRAIVMDRWDPDVAAGLIERERVTFMVGPPTFFLDLAATGSTLESLRLISCGGAGVTPEFCRRIAERFDVSVKRTYGSTEAPSVATARNEDPPDRAWYYDGRAVPGVALALESGELLVRGQGLFAGYVTADAPVSAPDPGVDDDGWFHTGDAATIDDEGWLRIVGRLGQLIIRGGENVSPLEVEEVLDAHTAVYDSIVFGLADPRLGERIAALVVADASFDLEECRRWFGERGIAKYRWPEVLARVNTVPRLASGKPDRTAAAALLAAAQLTDAGVKDAPVRDAGSSPTDPTA